MTKTMNALCFLIVGALAVASAPDAHAIPISAQYLIDVNSTDPGLVVHTMDIAANPYIDNLTLGVPVTFDLFRIWTDETAVNNPDDKEFKVAAVFWTFSAPPGGNVSVGTTFGTTALIPIPGGDPIDLGIGDAGQIVWANPTVIDFANGAQILVSLSNETYNAGVFDLAPGIDFGANVSATMELTRNPVPVPSSLTLLGLGLGGTWFTSRRRRVR